MGHMGTKHQKFSTSHKGSREDVVVQAASKPPTQLTQEEELEFDRSIDDKTKQNLKLKLIQGKLFWVTMKGIARFSSRILQGNIYEW